MPGEQMMNKKRIVLVLGGIAFLASLAGNAWLAATLRMYRYNVDHGFFVISREGPPGYPMVGLSSDEVRDMIAQIDQVEKDEDGRRILSLTFMGKDKVEITTGKLNRPLSGIGKNFRFNRAPSGWKLDAMRKGSWIA